MILGFRQILLLVLGGGIGTIIRYFVQQLLVRNSHSGLPYGTMFANLSGCLLIGLFYGIISRCPWLDKDSIRLFIITGLCGGYTTFSSFSIDGIMMLERGEILQFIIYTTVSVVFGLLLCWLGISISKILL